ncbi:MAG: ribosome biogenesis GTP-binding protein YihA/YsxC [bacterium]
MNQKVPLQERLDATFLTSAPDLKHCPRDAVPEVAFAGRSNAGKSSVLNTITGNRRMAKVSKTPGRTQMLNLFDLAGGGRLVDLPGYGYAKAGKSAQAQWQKSVNQYLAKRDSLVGLVLVTDIRHPQQPYDEELIRWSGESELPIRVLLNKADKLSFAAGQRAELAFNKHHANHPCLSVQCFSALKGTGNNALIEHIRNWLANAPRPSLPQPQSPQ